MECRLLNDGLPTLVAVAECASADTVAALRAKDGVEVTVCGADRVDLRLLMRALEDRGVRKLIVEGGSRLLHSLFEADIVSEIVIKHIPVIAGRGDAPGYLQAADGHAELPLSRWEVAEWFALGGIGISIYRRARA
jgi:5-amino-6-(5-phosphoribosylamino)uracil reductase/2,5-diamino-6-(ribosylamino)-4(3H)-pyrimidinone 5'-phosphate reductase